MAALEIQLAALGFTVQADALRDAKTLADRLVALKEAIAGLEGYQLAIRRHSRALRHTAADFEREQIAFVEGALRSMLERLVTRGAA